MTVTSKVLNLFYLLCILINSVAHGVDIKLYRHYKFRGLVWESNSTQICNDIPEDKRAGTHSIRTDTCFIAYYHDDCLSYKSQKYMPGHIKTSYEDLTNIDSFHVCNEEEGGSQLNVDITRHLHLYDLSPEVLESYKNVCSCVNVPQYVQDMDVWSINNHHNALLAYYEPNCSENRWNSTHIAAGHNPAKTNMERHTKTDSRTNTTYKVQSFGPDPSSTYFKTSCNSSTATTEPVMNTNIDFKIAGIQVLTNQIVKLQTQLDQLSENLQSIMKQQLDKFSETNRNECSQIREIISEKFQKLEKGQENLENQNEELLKGVASLQTFLHGKFWVGSFGKKSKCIYFVT